MKRQGTVFGLVLYPIASDILLLLASKLVLRETPTKAIVNIVLSAFGIFVLFLAISVVLLGNGVVQVLRKFASRSDPCTVAVATCVFWLEVCIGIFSLGA